MAHTSDRVRLVAWGTSGFGLGAVAAGLYALWGWPAAALFVGGCFLLFGLLAAVVAGAGGR